MRLGKISVFVVIGSLLTATVSAHSLLESGFSSGMSHPFHGVDHFLVAIAIGMLTAERFKSNLMIPFMFIAGMTWGSFYGFSQLELPFTEIGILFSLAVLGLVLFSSYKPSLKVVSPVLVLFGIAHGNAHGLEMQNSLSVLNTVTGLIVSTALLHGLGILIFTVLRHYIDAERVKSLLRFTGLGLAGVAILLYTQVL